jgi:hypothetical protein
MGPPKPVQILREPEFSRRLAIGEALYSINRALKLIIYQQGLKYVVLLIRILIGANLDPYPGARKWTKMNK